MFAVLTIVLLVAAVVSPAPEPPPADFMQEAGQSASVDPTSLGFLVGMSLFITLALTGVAVWRFNAATSGVEGALKPLTDGNNLERLRTQLAACVEVPKQLGLSAG